MSLIVLFDYYSRIGIFCISDEQLYDYPMNGFRKKCQNGIRRVFRAMLFCMSLHSVDVKGELVCKLTKPLSPFIKHNLWIPLIL